MKKRMKIDWNQKYPHYISISYEDDAGEYITRDFEIPFTQSGYAYVWETTNGMRHQVCGCLSRKGSTLIASPETLKNVIRSEYRAMRREERKEYFYGW